MTDRPIDAARSLRRGEGLLGLDPKMVILGLLEEIEHLQRVGAVPCAICGAGPTQNCDPTVHAVAGEA